MGSQVLNAGKLAPLMPVTDEGAKKLSFRMPDVSMVSFPLPETEAKVTKLIFTLPEDDHVLDKRFWRNTSSDEQFLNLPAFDATIHVRPDVWASDDEVDSFIATVYEDRGDTVE